MTQILNSCNSPDSNAHLAPITNAGMEKKPETALEICAEVVLDKALEAVKEENPIQSWMEATAPFLKSGGKTVAVILALGFISIPLMVCGGSGVALILATGASIVAICSCL
jgi:hypothetical protein